MKTNTWITNRPGRLALVFAGLLADVACAAPKYENLAYELTSSCDGDLKVIIRHDTDPREHQARLDERSLGTQDASRITELRAVDQYLEVTFSSGVWCRFLTGDAPGECYTNVHKNERAACAADLKWLEVLPPTRNDGF